MIRHLEKADSNSRSDPEIPSQVSACQGIAPDGAGRRGGSQELYPASELPALWLQGGAWEQSCGSG